MMDDQPHLGLATTRELLDELRARIEMHALGGLDYRTVDGEKFAEASSAEVERLKADDDVVARTAQKVIAEIITPLRAEIEQLKAEKSELADAILQTASEAHFRTLVSFELAEFIFTERRPAARGVEEGEGHA